MKDIVKVSLVQYAPVWLERERNTERMVKFTEEEARTGAELIVFPEISNVGYITPVTIGQLPSFDAKTTANEFAVKYIKASEPIPGPTTEALGNVTRRYGVYVVVGLSELSSVLPAVLHSSAVLIGPRGIVGVYRKVHIPLNERYFFHPGSTIEVFKTDLGNIGLSVCYDGRFPELARILGLKGAEIVCAVWASFGVKGLIDPEMMKHRAVVRAQENGFYYLSCNCVGKVGDTTLLGHSTMAAPVGDIIAHSDSDEEEVIRAELRNDEILKYRASLGVFRDRRPELYSLISAPIPEAYGLSESVTPDISLKHAEKLEKQEKEAWGEQRR